MGAQEAELQPHHSQMGVRLSPIEAAVAPGRMGAGPTLSPSGARDCPLGGHRPKVGAQIARFSSGGRDASPARPEGLRRPRDTKCLGSRATVRNARAHSPPPSEGARALRDIRPQLGCSPLIRAAVRALRNPVVDKRLESIGPVVRQSCAASAPRSCRISRRSRRSRKGRRCCRSGMEQRRLCNRIGSVRGRRFSVRDPGL
jgi:hypothetical protein